MPISIGMTRAGKEDAASSAARFEVGALWGVPAEGVLEDPAETGLQVGGGVPLPTSSGGLTPKIEKKC